MCLRKLLDYFLVGDVCLGGRDEYQSNCPHTTAQCCGSTVLSPVSADQFKRLFLMSHIKAVWSHHVDISSRNALCPGGQQLSLSVQSYLMKE